MTKQSNTAAAAPVVLKALHNDIVKANPTTTWTPKKMRVVLRQKLADIHAKNSSWVFTPADYARARALFDPAYAAKQAKATKATTRKPRAPKAKAPAKVEGAEVAGQEVTA